MFSRFYLVGMAVISMALAGCGGGGSSQTQFPAGRYQVFGVPNIHEQWSQTGGLEFIGSVDNAGQFTGEATYNSPKTIQNGPATGKITRENNGRYAVQLQFTATSASNADFSTPATEPLYRFYSSGEVRFTPAVSGGGITIDQHWDGFTVGHIFIVQTDQNIVTADYNLSFWPISGGLAPNNKLTKLARGQQ